MSWSVHHALMPHKHTHRTCSIAVAVAVVVFVALTFMLIANGVTNIIHWIRIRNSILSWEFQSWNCTKQFHEYSLKIHTQDWDCRAFFASSRSMCGQNANLPMWVWEFYCCFLAFFPNRVNRILSIHRSKADSARAKVAWQHPTAESTSTFINYSKDFYYSLRIWFWCVNVYETMKYILWAVEDSLCAQK